jgi:hypothetical protein
MAESPSRAAITMHSAVAVPIAIVLWGMVYLIAYFALNLLDTIRGLDDDKLQAVFRELITPGIGGYVAISAVHAWLPRAHVKFVMWAFGIPIFLFMIGVPLIVMTFLPEGWTFSWGEQVLRWLGGAATLIGAWIAYKQIVGD